MLDITWIGARIDDDRRDGVPLAAVWHIAEGSIGGEDSWANHPGNVDGVAPHFMAGRFVAGQIHQYVSVSRSARACGIRDGANPPDHGHAAWLLNRIGPVASPNRFVVNIETEGFHGWKLDNDVLANCIELGYFLWCTGNAACPHNKAADGHGALKAVPCDRDHNLRHGEIGGHPDCPGYTEDELATLIAGIRAKLAATVQPTDWDAVTRETMDSPPPVVSVLETHSLDGKQTNDAFNEIAQHFADVLQDNQGATMVAVTKAGDVVIPPNRKAVLVIY